MRNSVLNINGVKLIQVDYTLWSLIGETFIRHEYSPKGFDINSDDFVVDIGAHRGVFVGFAAIKRPKQILAIEPDNENFQVLHSFVLQNNFSNVTLLKCAVSSANGEIKLYKSTHSRHSAQTQKRDIQNALFEVVKSVSLNSLLDPYDIVDFLKVDCEGSEYDIFSSASLSTLRKIRKISMEIHQTENSKAVRELFSKLSKVFPSIKIKKLSPTLGMLYAKRD